MSFRGPFQSQPFCDFVVDNEKISPHHGSISYNSGGAQSRIFYCLFGQLFVQRWKAFFSVFPSAFTLHNLSYLPSEEHSP